MNGLLSQVLNAVQACQVKTVSNLVPEMDKDTKGEVLRAIILKRSEFRPHQSLKQRLARDMWRPVVVQLLETGVATEQLARHPEWSALKDALDFDDAPVMESLLRTVSIDKRSLVYKNFLHQVFARAVIIASVDCVKALLRREFLRFLDIERPIVDKANALVFTLFPKLDLEMPVLKHRTKETSWGLTGRRYFVAEALLKAGANPNQCQPYLPRPLLYETVCRGMDKESTLLLAFNANPNINDGDKELSLLCVAFREQCCETQKVLLEMPTVNLQYVTIAGTNLAHHAAQHGAFEAVEVLRQKGIDVCAPSRKGTVLKFAIGKSERIFRRVVDYCKNDPRPVVDFQTESGFAPVHIAALTGRRKQARVLLSELHANPNIQTVNGVTPAMLGALTAHLEMVKLFVEFNADLTLTDAQGRNILYSTVLGKSMLVFDYLIEQGIRPYGQDENGNTLLHEVTEKGSPEMLERLLVLEPDWFAVNKDGQTALDLLNPADKDKLAVWMRVAPQATVAAMMRRASAEAARPKLMCRSEVPLADVKTHVREN